MSQKSLLELRIGGLSGHFLQRLHKLLLGVIDVAQLMRGQVVHGLDVFGKESHWSSFVLGTRSRGPFLRADTLHVRC
jgi:hypothetical protein